MKAIRIHEHGGSEVMRLEEVPLPQPSAGEVRVKLAAIGVNFIDIYQRTGQYKLPLPFTTGQEAAGVVDAVGDGVTEFTLGDTVAYSSIVGAYAEYAVVPAAQLLHVPDGVDVQLAAAVVLQGMTAHYLTHDAYPLQPGNIALVHAAAGGTGLLVVQMAKKRGALVIGTVSTEEKAKLVREAGADEVIIYTQQDFEAETQHLTDGKGVHVVYDSVGKDTFDKGLNILRPLGYMVLFGQSSGAVAPFDPQILNTKGSLFLTRPTLRHYTAERSELERRANDIFNWIARDELSVKIHTTFPLGEAGAAHEALAGRGTTGKILLIP